MVFSELPGSVVWCLLILDNSQPLLLPSSVPLCPSLSGVCFAIGFSFVIATVLGHSVYFGLLGFFSSFSLYFSV